MYLSSTFYGDDQSNEDPVIQEILNKVGSNVESDFLDSLAKYPDLLREFYAFIKPSMDSGVIYYSAGVIRRKSWIIAREIDTTSVNHLKWLTTHKYSRENSRQIRYVIESFFYSEPIFAILTAIAQRWLSGTGFESELLQGAVFQNTKHVFKGKIEIVKKHANDDSLYSQSFYRALSVWPGYFDWIISEPDLQDKLEKASIELGATLDNIVIKMPVDTTITNKRDIEPALIFLVNNNLNKSLKVIAHTGIIRRAIIKSEISRRSNKQQNT